jgi:hypothetical protein
MSAEIVPGGYILAPCVMEPVRALIERGCYEESVIANRRTFLMTTAAAMAGATLPGMAKAALMAESVTIIGPKSGYSPQIGTLVSMLAWVRPAVTQPVKGTTQADPDVLFDANDQYLPQVVSCVRTPIASCRTGLTCR